MLSFLDNLLTASFHGSVVILAVLVLRLILRKTPKKYICLLWLLAGIRLLLPLEIRTELSLQPSVSLPAGIDWPAVLLWVWASVALAFGIYSVVSYLKLKAQVRDSVRIRGGWECDKIDTAFILGFIKPKIYIPMGMNHQARKHILEHERTHLEKGDHWIKMIGFLALALHWFNPLVWVAYILLCRDIELACDERVVQFMELEERKSYSAALIACSSRQMHFAASPVAFGEVSVKQRILSVLGYKKPGFWISLLGVAAFFFVALCLMTTRPAPADVPVVETLSPEEQAQQERMRQCYDAVQAAFEREEFFYQISSTTTNAYVGWGVDVYRLGDNTMWTYTPYNRGEIQEGRMELKGKHYAWQSGNWVETDTPDDRFDQWLDVFRWDTDTVSFIEYEEYDGAADLVFNYQWEEDNKTIHTAKVICIYEGDGTMQSMMIEQPDHETAEHIHLMFKPLEMYYEKERSVSDFFAEAEASIAEGMVTAEELAEQAEYTAWGIHFRVDDDRLSAHGSDVYFSQDELGCGNISTTDKYWLEKKVDGQWEEVPTIAVPQWTGEGIGVAKGTATFGYLDWTPLYGTLEAGQYRMGKVFVCYNTEKNGSRDHAFYSEFEIYESVDSSSPEAKAAVERCYAELEELKQRESIHWLSVMGEDSTMECWVNGEDFLRVSFWAGPDVPEEQWSEHDKSLFPRTDTSVRYGGVGYSDVRKDPEVLTSEVMGMGISTLEPDRAGWTLGAIEEDFNMLFFERSNHTISFPEGVGVVSDDMVRFVTSWQNVQDPNQYRAQLTYKFDENGDICYMEYATDIDADHEYVSYIQIFEDTAQEIDDKIRPYTEAPVVKEFSWSEAREKYTDEEFNIRQEGFVNTEVSPISGPVDAARRALKEYPNLGEYLSVEVYHDDTAGMWKVTIESYVDYQSTYGYRDVYIADNGVTCLLVYEGPIGWEEARK